MIKVVEPCCFHKQLAEMVDAAEGGEPVSVVSWGDVSLTQWLDFLVRRAKGAEVLLVLPKVLLPTLKGVSSWRKGMPKGSGWSARSHSFRRDTSRRSVCKSWGNSEAPDGVSFVRIGWRYGCVRSSLRRRGSSCRGLCSSRMRMDCICGSCLPIETWRTK